jgi:hypothetical protein
MNWHRARNGDGIPQENSIESEDRRILISRIFVWNTARYELWMRQGVFSRAEMISSHDTAGEAKAEAESLLESEEQQVANENP